MNEENAVDDLNQEQIIRNHLPKQAYATQNVQEEPDNVLPSKGKTKSRHTLIIGVGVSIVVLTSLLLFIVLGFGMGILMRIESQLWCIKPTPTLRKRQLRGNRITVNLLWCPISICRCRI